MSDEEKSLGFFERYLAIWVGLCMVVGLVLSQYLPGLSLAIDSWQVRGISVPIGICLFLMMYPALLNLRLEELRNLARNPKPILLTLFSNWIIAPVVTVVLANTFLKGHDQLIVSLILLGSSPCTAMVLVWGTMADGNQEQNFITISLYGLGSQAALGTTMGLFWEVPVMLSLVYLGKRLRDRGFWGAPEEVERVSA